MPTTPDILHDLGAMRIRAYMKGHDSTGDELSLDRIKGEAFDVTKVRAGIWEGQVGYGLCVSLDVLTGDDTNPRRSERMFLAFGLDDSSKAQPGAAVFQLDMAGAVDGSGEDYDMRAVLRISRAEGAEFFVPIKASGGTIDAEGEAAASGIPTSGVTGYPFRLSSPGGRWVWNAQDDGRLIQYDRLNPETGLLDDDESLWRAVWSNR